LQAGIKYGHFYATRLLAALGMGTVEEPCPDGVIRISLVHYTTLEQVDQLIRMLDEVL
jgi:selenocysteine lyase/cysteine desulfurase